MMVIGALIVCVGLVFILKGFFVKKADGLRQEVTNSRENISKIFGLGFVITGYGLAQNEPLILQNLGWIVLALILLMLWNIVILMQKMSKYNEHKELILAENLKVFAQSLKKSKEESKKE